VWASPGVGVAAVVSTCVSAAASETAEFSVRAFRFVVLVFLALLFAVFLLMVGS
jgi:hypothetical protein